MVVVRSFRGLRPRKDIANKVASPPYDVLDSDEARVIVRGNPLSFLRVVKPEVDLEEDVDLYSAPVYEQGANNLNSMVEEGTMVLDNRPCYYFYRQVMGDHEQYGLVATVSAWDYEDDRIKKHEFTRPDKEADRVRHIETQNAQCGPVFLTYEDIPEFNELQERFCGSNDPEVDFTADDGIRHTLWVVNEEGLVGQICSIFGEVPHIYVADGHHRSAAGTIVAKNRKQNNPSHMGTEEYNYFLAVLFPESHMKILAYNRAVADLNGRTPEAFLEEISTSFDVTEGADPEPSSPRTFSMYLGGKWYGLVPKDGTFPAQDPVKCLDASILQDNLLRPVLGIEDPRTAVFVANSKEVYKGKLDKFYEGWKVIQTKC